MIDNEVVVLQLVTIYKEPLMPLDGFKRIENEGDLENCVKF